MSDNSSSSSGGISAISLLGVVFVALKLCHVIDWSWWWVTAPFWGGFVMALAILALVILWFVSKEVVAYRREKRSK